MIVIDRDIFKITTEEIPKTNVLVTMMNGQIVHEEAVDWGGESKVLKIVEAFDVCADHDHGNGEPVRFK